jgi:hypothetical protein
LLAAVAQATDFTIQEYRSFAKFPQLDLNMPLPHGSNGFPDVKNKRRVSEGAPLIFSWAIPGPGRLPSQNTSGFDLTRRGKYGETIRFHTKGGVPKQRAEMVNINAQDRHGNTAVASALLSDCRSGVSEFLKLRCDLKMGNENGDGVWDLGNLRVKRSQTH